MNVLIISGGSAPSKELIDQEMKKCDCLICADSGGKTAYDKGLLPDYLAGDFDSLDEEILKYFSATSCKISRYSPEKDNTDTEIALNLAVSLGARDITFIGCTGTRIDHMMGNLGLLKKCLDINIKSRIKDDYNTVFLTDKPLQLDGGEGQFFSLQAYCDKVEKLSIYDAKYELRDYDLHIGDPRTISNEFLGKRVNINFSRGIIMVFLSTD